MSMDVAGIELEAEAIYRSAGVDLREGAAPMALIRTVLGASAVRFVPRGTLREGGALARVGDSWRIYLRKGLPLTEVGFIALHELAHFVLGERGTEQECDALAAALIIPRQALDSALAARPRAYTKIADWFHCSESLVVLRIGEVVMPTALVTPERVRVRGADFEWPTGPELRRVVEGAQPLPGLRKARLRDDPQRLAIRVR